MKPSEMKALLRDRPHADAALLLEVWRQREADRARQVEEAGPEDQRVMHMDALNLRIAELSRDGLSDYAIARLLDMSVSAINYRRNWMGLPPGSTVRDGEAA